MHRIHRQDFTHLCYYSSFADHLKYILHVNIPCAILLLLFLYIKLKITMNPLSSKVHFLAQTRQTKRRTNRKSTRTSAKFRACADVFQLCHLIIIVYILLLRAQERPATLILTVTSGLRLTRACLVYNRDAKTGN